MYTYMKSMVWEETSIQKEVILQVPEENINKYNEMKSIEPVSITIQPRSLHIQKRLFSSPEKSNFPSVDLLQIFSDDLKEWSMLTYFEVQMDSEGCYSSCGALHLYAKLALPASHSQGNS